ncbi:NmrA family transcriptional regulator [Pandoraea iniqua]|uniref:NmrA family NAD(P)-binding protein n=1 Tax=Pandoraea iniqua TaxID=2508288 RepID=UPI0012423086|nr:NAD(P)H-binding protein [Pandoraea iniqua]VVD77705.1 NmrA family transcriptional regulator [Pandoraea iniqua]
MYVIFGASGNVGRSTVAALLNAGQAAHGVRAVVRDPAQHEVFKRMGCEVVAADLDDEASLHRALEGAQAVQLLCPVAHGAADPEAAMRNTIRTTARTLREYPHLHVLALSDYGAELDAGSGITMLFRELETAYREVAPRLTLLRSAEHMHNWARTLLVALSSGRLPSFHHPVDRPFPTVAAKDVGVVAAQLLLDGHDGSDARIVSVEGPRRYHAEDVARTLGDLSGREVAAFTLPRSEWASVLSRAGLNANLANLVMTTFDAQNAGSIDVEAGSERRFGTTELRDVLAALMSAFNAR